MARQEAGVVGELHDFLNRTFELDVVRIGQVGTADRPTDDQVTADQQLFGGEMVHDVTWRVAGGVDDGNGDGAEVKLVAVVDELVGFARGDFEGELE